MDVLETIKALVGGDTNVSSVIELDGGVQIRVKDASAVKLSEICALAGGERQAHVLGPQMYVYPRKG